VYGPPASKLRDTDWNGADPVARTRLTTSETETPAQPGAIRKLAVTTLPAVTMEPPITAPPVPGHAVAPAVDRPPSLEVVPVAAVDSPPCELPPPLPPPPPWLEAGAVPCVVPPPAATGEGAALGAPACGGTEGVTGVGSAPGEVTGFGVTGREWIRGGRRLETGGSVRACPADGDPGPEATAPDETAPEPTTPEAALDCNRVDAELGLEPLVARPPADGSARTKTCPVSPAGKRGSATGARGGSQRNADAQSTATPTAATPQRTTRRPDRMATQ